MKDVRLYTRTLRSEHAVATIGSEGCGAVCHVREFDGGVRVARGERMCVGDSVGPDILEGPQFRGGLEPANDVQLGPEISRWYQQVAEAPWGERESPPLGLER